jgi:hypothetical protein
MSVDGDADLSPKSEEFNQKWTKAYSSLPTDVIFSPEPAYASDVTVNSSDGKQFLLHSQILQMKSKVRGSYVCVCARAHIFFVVF